jgi:hypothetical protein
MKVFSVACPASFANEADARTRSDAEGYRARVWSALIEVARRQSEHQREANPVDRFFALLRSAIASGRAHVATRDGGMPDNPGAWGRRAGEPTRNPAAEPLDQRQRARATLARSGMLKSFTLIFGSSQCPHRARSLAARTACGKPAAI